MTLCEKCGTELEPGENFCGGCGAKVAATPTGVQQTQCVQALTALSINGGQEIRIFDGHTGGVTSIAFSPDGQYLVSGSLDGFIKIWDIASGREIHTIDGHEGGVSSVVYSPDGRCIVSGGLDRIVNFWDAASGMEILSYKEQKAQEKGLCLPPKRSPHTSEVINVAFSPNGKWLASGSPGQINIWDAASRSIIKTYKIDVNMSSIAFSPDSESIVYSTSLGVSALSVVPKNNPAIKRHLNLNEKMLFYVAFSPDGKYIAVGSIEPDDTQKNVCQSKIRLLDAADEDSDEYLEEIYTFDGAFQAAFSSDGKYMASFTFTKLCPKGGFFIDGSVIIKLWEVASGVELPFTYELDEYKHYPSIAFSPDGTHIAFGDGNYIKIWQPFLAQETQTEYDEDDVKDSAEIHQETTQKPEQKPQDPNPDTAVVKLCASCGKEIQSDWAVCPYCKTEVAAGPPSCAACGKELDPDWQICPYCKTEV